MNLRRFRVIATLTFALGGAGVLHAQESAEANAEVSGEVGDESSAAGSPEGADLELAAVAEPRDQVAPSPSAVTVPQDDVEVESPAPSANRNTHVGIGFGSGFGLATGEGVVYGDDTSTESGFAASPVQLYLEAGRTLIPKLEVVLSGQFQAVFLDSGLELVPRFRIAARYQVLSRGRWSIDVQAGGGYGYQIHYVKLDDEFINQNGELETVTDTDRTREGPGHVGAGAYFRFAISDSLGVFIDTFVMGMFPQTSAHLDANIGLDIVF